MKRSFIAVALAAVAVLATSSAGAVVDTNSALDRFAFVGWSEPTPTGSVGGWLSIDQRTRAATSDLTATPAADFTAQGVLYVWTTSPCCTYTTIPIPLQAVSPTALSMDPIGNSARFTGTLTSNLGAHAFDLTLVEPAGMTYGVPCTNGCVNAWHNPGTNKVGATTYNATGISRYGYKVTGVADGVPLTPSGGVYAQTFAAISNTAGVVAP